jgi:SAM-dependent methyltransferase
MSWPKQFSALTPEQERVRDDFMLYWHRVLPKNYSIIERFNQRAAFRRTPLAKPCTTLEIGAGIGEHLRHEDLVAQNYYALELRPEMAAEIRKQFPTVTVVVGDIQKRNEFQDGFFDRIVAVHVLEHLPDLPRALQEMKRMLKPAGVCDLVLPCEGSLAYGIARKISAERLFKKRYGMSYRWLIEREHCNTYQEIIAELQNSGFRMLWKNFFPLPLPLVWCNLVVGVQGTFSR